MSEDISRQLSEWSVDDPPVRMIQGEDGQPKVQRRLALGILQLNVDGRPDGRRPHGMASYYDYYRRCREEQTDSFRLTSRDCEILAAEALLYFQRRICFFDLGEFGLAARDAERNLEVFSFAKKHAAHEEDAWTLDQYRGFVLTHRGRAKALDALERNDLQGALSAVDEACEQVLGYLDEYQIDEEMAAGDELRQLRRLREQIVGHPATSDSAITLREILEQQLRVAILHEQYERAAQIRDRLSALTSD